MTQPPDNKKGILLESGTNEVEFLQFGVGRERYGINVGKVRQLLTFQESMLTKLPGTTGAILGAIYFRDKPSAIIDLNHYFKTPEDEMFSGQKLVVMTEFNQHTVGFVIDQVYGIARFSWTEFSPIKFNEIAQTNGCVVGTVTIDNSVVLILDVEQILSELIPSASLSVHVDDVPACNDQTRADVKILYCEDSTIVQKVLLSTLKKAGFNLEQIAVCMTGEEGLKTAQENKGQFDLILTDIEMPRMDGLTLCKELKQMPTYKNVPVIFFSSMITEEMTRKCISVGGNSAYSKPEVHKIVAEIDSLLKLRES